MPCKLTLWPAELFLPSFNQQNSAKAAGRHRECSGSKRRKMWTASLPHKARRVKGRNFGLFWAAPRGKYVSGLGAWTATSKSWGPFKCEFKYKWICLGQENPSRRRSKEAEKGQSWAGRQSSVRHSRTGPNNSGMNSIRNEGGVKPLINCTLMDPDWEWPGPVPLGWLFRMGFKYMAICVQQRPDSVRLPAWNWLLLTQLPN